MQCILLQPPFTQLNAPYPAIWYLDRFLRDRGHDSHPYDSSIMCLRSIFSAVGLRAIFAQARLVAGTKQKQQNTVVRQRIADYFRQEDDYCHSIEAICAYLSGEDPGFAYRLAVGAGIPSGMRTEAVLGEAGGIQIDDAPALATAVLNDLSDFIRGTVDSGFETVRYAERIPASASSFETILNAVNNSWILQNFYRPLLDDIFSRHPRHDSEPVLVCLSVPFPGCLAAAVMAAQCARQHYGPAAIIILGGGYVSTELRTTEDQLLFRNFDYLAYDGGYGALLSIIDHVQSKAAKAAASAATRATPTTPAVPTALYGTRWLDSSGLQPSVVPLQNPVAEQDPDYARQFQHYREKENQAIAEIHPDYRAADFSQYLRIVDSPNPMHRLWNNTPWLKYRMAYGCYWQRCAFCDTQLHYIKHYQLTDQSRLLQAMEDAAGEHKLYGIHFVDEAMPPRLVRSLAAINRSRKRPFTFWGNIRFDKSWTAELCAEAAAGGLVAVSGGIEIASGKGLQIIDKGFTLNQLLVCLANFKQAGILVHAYLIYGFPGQSHQDIADSAEMVRVLLAEGLIDSAFWHRFILTTYSRLHGDYKAGSCKNLQPLYPSGSFAENDLGFQGEADYDPWTAVLDSALAAWADEGQTELPLRHFMKGQQSTRLPTPRVQALKLLREAGVI